MSLARTPFSSALLTDRCAPPLHAWLQVSEFYYFAKGNAVGYADPKSLTSGPERAYPHGGLEEFKPSLMCAAPPTCRLPPVCHLPSISNPLPL